MIEGVRFLPLEMHRDERGHLTELFRAGEIAGFHPKQWHLLTTRAGGLRGMHVHLRHDDYKVLVEGSLAFVLKDLRTGSPTEGAAELHELSADQMCGIFIPVGVAHGLIAHEWSLVAVAVTHLYDPSDDFEFRWDDPALGVDWPYEPTLVSERDRNAPSLGELLASFRRSDSPQ
jgi:dTDP-4-dehydrorhamnose 3,5-epimerase